MLTVVCNNIYAYAGNLVSSMHFGCILLKNPSSLLTSVKLVSVRIGRRYGKALFKVDRRAAFHWSLDGCTRIDIHSL